MARFLLGDLAEVVALSDTFIPQRPIADAGTSHYGFVDPEAPGVVLGAVENEDFVAALFRTVSGVTVILESSRVAAGDQNHYAFEVHGTKGLVRWDFRRSGELAVSSGSDYQGQSTSTVRSGPGDGAHSALQPGAGIAMGNDDTKVVEARGFLQAIEGERGSGATIADAVMGDDRRPFDCLRGVMNGCNDILTNHSLSPRMAASEGSGG